MRCQQVFDPISYRFPHEDELASETFQRWHFEIEWGSSFHRRHEMTEREDLLSFLGVYCTDATSAKKEFDRSFQVSGATLSSSWDSDANR